METEELFKIFEFTKKRDNLIKIIKQLISSIEKISSENDFENNLPDGFFKRGYDKIADGLVIWIAGAFLKGKNDANMIKEQNDES